MVHEIGSIENVPKGDTIELPLTVTSNGDPIPIDGYDIDYYIIRRGNIVDRAEDNDDIDITFPDPENGELLIRLGAGVTSDYPDYVDEIIRVDDTRGGKVTFLGHINFKGFEV